MSCERFRVRDRRNARASAVSPRSRLETFMWPLGVGPTPRVARQRGAGQPVRTQRAGRGSTGLAEDRSQTLRRRCHAAIQCARTARRRGGPQGVCGSTDSQVACRASQPLSGSGRWCRWMQGQSEHQREQLAAECSDTACRTASRGVARSPVRKVRTARCDFLGRIGTRGAHWCASGWGGGKFCGARGNRPQSLKAAWLGSGP